MLLKSYSKFLSESFQEKRPWVFTGNFKVTNKMVNNGKLIKEMIPDEVIGDFFCEREQLISLEGCPTTILGSFFCEKNELTSLEGCPTTISGQFWCNHNKLTTLKGCPATISGRRFYCNNNKLTSLEGIPTIALADVHCSNNLADLTIEREFVKSGSYSNQKTYWPELLTYMINKKIDLNNIKSWPEGFLSPEIIKSASGIAKFNL